MDERYQVGNLIEEFSYGKQFAAEDTLIQRPVQIFRFQTPTGDEEEWQEKFGLLSSELATIAHPGLPIIYDHGNDADGPYLIRQLQDSVDINHHLMQHGAFSEYEGWELAHQMLEIFDATKTTGNFHGALDPANVRFMARPSGAKRFTVTDYGLAEIHKQISGDTEFLGATYLISPEQARGEEITEQSQIFAIGQLLFHVLSGGHPWLETSLDELKQVVQEAPLDPIVDYNPSIPAGFSDWLQKMIAIDPADRFQTYEEATEQLPEPIQSAPVPISASTATVAQTVAAAQTITSSQAVTPAEGHVTTAAEDFAAKQAAAQETKKSSANKNPIIFGAAGAVVLLIIIIILMSGGDDEEAVPTTPVANTASNEVSGLPQKGLVSFIDFNNRSVSDPKNGKYTLESLKKRPTFSNNGLSGKALIIDQDHIYRLPIAGTAIADRSKDFTVSFWVKSATSAAKELTVLSPEPWHDGDTAPFEGDDNLWKWTPDNDSSVETNQWNFVTMIYSRKSGSVELYLNGELLGTSGTDEIDANKMNRYIYIGCDSNENFTHQSPMIIDDLIIWDRTLSEDEIYSIYNSSI